jgi:hypothetical protein
MPNTQRVTLRKALVLLQGSDAKLVRLHGTDGQRGFYIWPRGGRISDQVAKALLERNDVQPYDNGLLSGHPQSWRLGNWRDRGPA